VDPTPAAFCEIPQVLKYTLHSVSLNCFAKQNFKQNVRNIIKHIKENYAPRG